VLVSVGCASSTPGGSITDADSIDPAPDAAPPFLPGWHGQFCAAGAELKSDDGELQGTYCFGPLDTALQPGASGGLLWEPGPIYVVSP
jgi:hypothetical protein